VLLKSSSTIQEKIPSRWRYICKRAASWRFEWIRSYKKPIKICYFRTWKRTDGKKIWHRC